MFCARLVAVMAWRVVFVLGTGGTVSVLVFRAGSPIGVKCGAHFLGPGGVGLVGCVSS